MLVFGFGVTVDFHFLSTVEARESTMFYVLHEDAWTMHLACVPQVFANTLVFLEVLNFFGTSDHFTPEREKFKVWVRVRVRVCVGGERREARGWR